MKRIAPILLKVCGMRDKENIREVVALKPDYLGFIFYAKSSRFVGQDYKMPSIPETISKVGVFVNENTETMLKLRDKYALDYLQLHGNETPAQVRELKGAGVKVFKVFSIDADFDFESTRPYEEFSDFFLFDTRGKYYGGNGVRFDWRLLQDHHHNVPFLLSGGIAPENVNDIANMTNSNLHAVDINSGVEIAPAVKDPGRIREVIEKLKKINIDKTIAL
jgi:phosphoribosylanthranilate isomerase